MRFQSEADLQQLIDHRIPESASLEYKGDLPLGKPRERLEVLKDLTGMANGGGGTIIYGMAEERIDDWPIADHLNPITDFGLVGKLENIWRDGVRPPLLVDYSTIDLPAGFVLGVDLQPSPLGPYMIEAYGERRHFLRHGTSSVPMTEQQIRDAYALAFRVRERRPLVWEEHALPLSKPTSDPWIVASALPEEPLHEILDMRTVDVVALQPPASLATYMTNFQLGDLTPTFQGMKRWVDGFYGEDAKEDAAWRVVRLHRDGAGAIALRVQLMNDVAGEAIWPTHVARLTNAALLYLGWFWRHFGLVRPVELRIDLHNTNGLSLINETGSTSSGGRLTAPPDISIDPLFTIEYFLPWEMGRASLRHQVLMRFADRLHQAAGGQISESFRFGYLHNKVGECVDLTVGSDVIWDEKAGGAGTLASIMSDGSVVKSTTGGLVGWYRDGVVLDLHGNALAVLEMAPGAGCPDGFVGTSLRSDPFGTGGKIRRVPNDPAVEQETVEPTGRWSADELRDVLKP